jgi:hypothetical protein
MSYLRLSVVFSTSVLIHNQATKHPGKNIDPIRPDPIVRNDTRLNLEKQPRKKNVKSAKKEYYSMAEKRRLIRTVKPENRIKITMVTDIIACPCARSLVTALKIENKSPIPIEAIVERMTNMM